ncbi:MAG: hypothetical protein IJV12_00380 [Acidaminococcaceae bacterium]|nr:hypothetical protein [Acidaminococcaceae bacterium]
MKEVIFMKLKLHQLQSLDALLKRLACEQSQNIQPQLKPQLVISLDDQLVAGDYFHKYENGRPFTFTHRKNEMGEITVSSDQVPPIDYHLVQDFYLRQFPSKESSISYLFENPAVLFSILLQDKYLNLKIDEGQPFIFNPRFLGRIHYGIEFLQLDKDAEFELISLALQPV